MRDWQVMMSRLSGEEEQYIDWVSDHTRRIMEDPTASYDVYDVNAEQIWMYGEGVPLHEIQAHGAVMVGVVRQLEARAEGMHIDGHHPELDDMVE